MEQDSPWKEVLEDLFEEFLEFFFPEVHRDLDFTQGYEFLDKELQQILVENEKATYHHCGTDRNGEGDGEGDNFDASRYFHDAQQQVWRVQRRIVRAYPTRARFREARRIVRGNLTSPYG